MPFVLFPDPEPERPHPTRETYRSGGNDAKLRRHGYVIFARPNGKEPLWSLGTWRPGDPVYTQSEALARVDD